MTYPPQGGQQPPFDPRNPNDPRTQQDAHSQQDPRAQQPRAAHPEQGGQPWQQGPYGQQGPTSQQSAATQQGAYGQGQSGQQSPYGQGQQGSYGQSHTHAQPGQGGPGQAQSVSPGRAAASHSAFGSTAASGAHPSAPSGAGAPPSSAYSVPSAAAPQTSGVPFASPSTPGAASGATTSASYGVPTPGYANPGYANPGQSVQQTGQNPAQQGAAFGQPFGAGPAPVPGGYGSGGFGPSAPSGAQQTGQFAGHPNGARPRKSPLLLILAIPAAALIAGLGGYFIGTSNGSTLAAEPLQAEVTRVLQDDFGLVEVADVTCPEQVKVDQGSEFQCTFTYAGQDQSVTVTVTSADGQVVVGAPE